MKRIGFIIITLILCRQVCTAAPLGEDKAIYRKNLPCGLTSYIITNPVEKLSCEIAVAYRGNRFYNFIDSLSRIPAPYKFLENKGITATLANEGEYNFLCRFENINTAKPEIVDSTLLLAFNIIADDPSPMTKLDDYAVIVSGDIDKKLIEDKIKVFSLMLLKKHGAGQEIPAYTFKEYPQVDIQIRRNGSNRLTFTFKSPRRDLSNTSPLVHLFSEKLNIEMIDIVKNRIRHALTHTGIPYRTIDVNYLSSADSEADETLSISLEAVSPDDLNDLTTLCTKEIVSLKEYHFDKSELKQAEAFYYRSLFSRENISNHKYVSLCANNYHYGGAIIPPAEKLKYLQKKVITDSLHREMMVQHIGEVVEINGRLSIVVETSDSKITHESIADAFALGTKPEKDRRNVAALCFDRSLVQDKKAVAIPLRTDGFFQGTILICTNGIEIHYKPMPKTTKYHITYAIPNNLLAYKDLPQGVAGLLGDLILNGTEDCLVQNNIRLKATVTTKETCFTAVVAKDRLDSLFLLLSSITAKTQIGEKELEYFIKCHKQDHSAKATLDSLLFPDFKYSLTPSGTNLKELTRDCVNDYLTTLCSNRTKGRLLVVGPDKEDVAGHELGKALSYITAIKGLETKKVKTTQPNPKTRPFTIEDRTPKDRKPHKMSFVYTYRQALDSDAYFAMLVGSLYFENEINKILSTSPYRVKFEHYWDSFPEPRYYFYAFIEQSDINVVSSAKKDLTFQDVVKILEAKLKKFTIQDVSTKDLDAIKKRITAELDFNQNRPDYWLELMNVRRLEKKNLNNKYKEKLKAITAQDIVDFYRNLYNGAVAVVIE